MEEQKVILHGTWICPHVKRVELALRLKNIPFDFVEEDFSNKSELLLKYNPVYKKVPVLVHNGKPICESHVILEYIDETWKHGPKLLPQDPYRRAQARFWSKFIQDQFEAFYAVFKAEGESQQKAMKEMEEKLDVLEHGMSKYFADGKPVDVNENNAEMLDLMFYSLLGLYKSYEEVFGVKLLDEDKFPLLFPWLMAFVQLKVVKEATPPHEKVVQFLHFVRRSALRSASAAS